ncbi:tRNA (adenosine(37)-N6)-threonylcarbamoyltransferase complex dimerization subunit type 1 TsaB [Candidatus Saccharibacteria bacterium]|nr:tRNA (adenosine(37)-N6)-threonylcarbamoyltransferase complex dimerization subunit type 1 TsaB [Candidatus Saccharibacteria bacterium]
MILALKTSGDPTEIYILDNTGKIIAEKKWDAGRTLARDLLSEIEKLLARTELAKGWEDLTGVIVFRGPGSFTGLRIGITVANAIAYGRNIPIVGTNGDDWLASGLKKLQKNQNNKIVLPEYGAPPNITKPKK